MLRKMHMKKSFYAVFSTLLMLLVFTLTAALSGCSKKIPDNSVFSVDDLSGKVIGVQLGTTGDTYIQDKYEGDDAGSKVERFSKGADAIQSLKLGKLDAVVIDLQTAKAFVEANHNLRILDEEFVNEDYAICIAKNNTELTASINQALEELKADGTLTNIANNYIGDNIGKSPYVSPQNADRSNGTLIMATNAYFPPYEFYKDGKVVGIDAEMAQALADKLGKSS